MNAHPDQSFSLAVGTDTSFDLVVATTGRVGIGTSNPAALLDVAGAANFSGQVSFSGGQLSVGNSQLALVPPNTGVGNDSYTKLLLHMDSNFNDSASSPKTMTVSGATINTASVKFGAGSGYFGTSANVKTGDNPDWNFGTGDFTIDLWVKRNAIQNQYVAMLAAAPSGDTVGYNLAFADTNKSGLLLQPRHQPDVQRHNHRYHKLASHGGREERDLFQALHRRRFGLFHNRLRHP